MGHRRKPECNGDSASAAVPATSGDDDSGSPNCEVYNEGELVLAYHSNRFYEAKVEKVEGHEKDWSYYIHYRGWKRHWDEWVRADRLLKNDEENLLKKKLLDEQHNAVKNARHVKTLPNNAKNSASGKKQKNHPADSDHKMRRKHSIDKGKYIASTEKLINITIPLTLKKQLMDDHEFVVQMDKLFKLPRTPNVVEILKKYHDYRKKEDGVITESVQEIMSGLRVYFDQALPVRLLYNKERQEYHDAVAEDESPADVYGAEHLLRLFVKLPALLMELNIDEETSAQLQQNLNDFLKFLQKNQGAFFRSTYHTAEESENSSQRDGS